MLFRAAAILVVLGAAALARAALAEERPPQETLLGHLERAFAAAAERVAPSVVALEVEREPEKPAGDASLPPFLQRPSGLVSGLAVGERRILTAAWNVEGATSVRVVLPGGARLDARVLGRDEGLDLALVEIAPHAVEATEPGPAGGPLDPVRLEDAVEPRVGAWLVAVGRGPAGAVVVNAGIVSARGRLRGQAIQTDAPLNYGNFGGAAVDVEGRLVGIPVRMSPRTGVNSGVGFVIPAARAREVLAGLARGEARPAPARAFLGVQFGREAMEPEIGVELARVVEGTAAAEGGLEGGDILLRIGDASDLDAISASDAIQAHRPGERVRIVVRRGGRRLGLEVVLGERSVER